MFFCIDLVYATEGYSSTRVIGIDNNTEDIRINLNAYDFVLTNAVIDPFTKDNISTYIVKENVPISFDVVNPNVELSQVLLEEYYYTTLKNKNIKIRCLDKEYSDGSNVNILPNNTYVILKATNKLSKNIFIVELNYKIRNGEEILDKSDSFAFKIVSDKEYDMYKSMEELNVIKEDPNKIIRPKKQTS